jgi:hypothetical protein
METLIINTHLTYPGWSEGKLNLTLMELAKTFFVERGHTVTETMVERGYKTDEEVSKTCRGRPRHPADSGELVRRTMDLQEIRGRSF